MAPIRPPDRQNSNRRLFPHTVTSVHHKAYAQSTEHHFAGTEEACCCIDSIYRSFPRLTLDPKRCPFSPRSSRVWGTSPPRTKHSRGIRTVVNTTPFRCGTYSEGHAAKTSTKIVDFSRLLFLLTKTKHRHSSVRR